MYIDISKTKFMFSVELLFVGFIHVFVLSNFPRNKLLYKQQINFKLLVLTKIDKISNRYLPRYTCHRYSILEIIVI